MMRWMGWILAVWGLGCGAAWAVETTWEPRLAAGVAYTDNVFLEEADEDEDFIYTVTPGLTLALNGRYAGLQLAYDPSYKRYEKESRDDYWQHAASGSAWARFSKNARAEVRNTYLKTENPISEEDYTVRRGRQSYYRNTATARYDHQFGREDRFGLSYTHTLLENKDSAVEDSRSMVPGAEVVYWLGPRWGLQAQGTYRRSEYDVSDDFDNWYGLGRVNRRFNPRLVGYVQFGYTLQSYDGASEDFKVYDGGLGLTWEIDQSATFDLQAGYFVRKYDGRDDVDGFPVILSYDRRFKRGSLGISTGGGYDTTVATAENLGFYTYYFGQVRASYDFYERLTGGLDLYVRRTEYEDQVPSYRDDTLRGSVYLSCKVTSWMALRLEYAYRTVDSEENTRDYVENSGMLRVTLQPPRPLRI